MIKKRNKQALELHTFWKIFAHQEILYTEDKDRIVLVNLGRYSQNCGPDFLGAHLRLGEMDLIGDIEIHLNEEEWHLEDHRSDPRYNNVILHVFLQAGEESKPAFNHLNKKMRAWKIPEALWHQFLAYSSRGRQNHHTLGICGLSLQEKKYHARLQRFIIQSAQMRLEKKSKEYKDWAKNQLSYNQILYQSIIRALGYTAYQTPFFNLAKVYDYDQFYKTLKTCSLREAFIESIGRMLRCLNLLDTAKKQFADWHDLFSEMEQRDFVIPENKALFIPEKMPTYPNFNPISRLILFFFHNYNTTEKQLFNTWYLLLKDLQKNFIEHGIIRENRSDDQMHYDAEDESIVSHHKICKRLINQALKKFSALFTLPINYQSFFQSKQSTISRDRMIVLLVNVIVPIYYCWAEDNNDALLKRTLFQIFIQMPPENTNHKIRFMENRFGLSKMHQKANTPLYLIKNMSYCQGLIHIYDQYCRTFDDGCQSCMLADFLNVNE